MRQPRCRGQAHYPCVLRGRNFHTRITASVVLVGRHGIVHVLQWAVYVSFIANWFSLPLSSNFTLFQNVIAPSQHNYHSRAVCADHLIEQLPTVLNTIGLSLAGTRRFIRLWKS